ncbi:pentatricopeptide repeat-containing protein [Acrasis kona]|uniref:Pentatricopeptide repeat-containing protein n=1 Tax=Acrasis kona TaxID=1008807 RepID=A0AAW2ZM03_9EUKA
MRYCMLRARTSLLHPCCFLNSRITTFRAFSSSVTTDQSYTSQIISSTERNDVSKVNSLIAEVEEKGLSSVPLSEEWKTVLVALIRGHYAKQAVSWYWVAQQQHVYFEQALLRELLDLCLEHNSSLTHQGASISEHILKSDSNNKSMAKSYLMVFDALNGRTEKAMEHFNSLKNEKNIRKYFCLHLINALQSTEAVKVCDYMKEVGLPVDNVIHSRILKFCKSEGNYPAAVQYFENISDRDHNAIRHMLRFSKESNDQELPTRVAEMVLNGQIKPSVKLYTVLMSHAYDEHTERRILAHMESVLAHMKSNKEAKAPDRSMLTSLIDKYTKQGDLKLVTEAINEVERLKIHLDPALAHVIIRSHAKFGQPEKAIKLFEQSNKKKLNRISCTTIMYVYKYARDYDSALKLIKRIKKEKLEIDFLLYESIILTFCKFQQVKIVLAVFDEMIEKKIFPNEKICRNIIAACSKFGFKPDKVLNYMASRNIHDERNFKRKKRNLR